MDDPSKCAACGKAIPPSRGSRPRRWCSDRCRSWARKNPGKKRPLGSRVCLECGKSIDHLILKAIFCGDRCRQRYRAQERRAATPLRRCLKCGKEFRPFRDGSRWCSIQHYKAWWQRQWAKANPDRVRQIRQQVRASRTEEQLLRDRERSRLDAQVRRARQRSTTVVPFTDEQLRQRMSMFSGCWMCGGPFEHIEHVKPLAAGGAHMLANLRPSCGPCNWSKGHRWPLEVPIALAGAGIRRRISDSRV